MARILILAANIGMTVGGYGGAERSLRLAESMPEHDVTVLMSSMNKDYSGQEITPRLRTIHVIEDRNMGSQISQYAKREFEGNLDIATYVLSGRLTRYRAELKKLLETTDLVILDHVGSLGLVKGIDIKVPVLYASHNCEADLAKQMYERYPTNKKYMYDMEKEIIDISDAITYCSKDDIEKMDALYNITKPTFYVPNGTDKQKLNRNNFESKDLIFIGSGHGPNVEAAKNLINTARLLPEYRFNIIGKCGLSIPKENLPPNYIVHGFLSDHIMGLLFENAFAFLNPMTAGSGTHLKIMRALSYGLPIISSTIGLRGFSNGEIDGTLLVANNDNEILAAIEKLKDKNYYESISVSTQKLVQPYLWTEIQKDFNAAVESLLDGVEETIENGPKKNVMIYSIVRNNIKTVDRYYNQIKSVVNNISGYDFYLSIYENDSEDGTASALMSKDWSFLSGVSITSEKINTSYFGSVKSAERVENLAKARNKAIESSGFLDIADYILMVEGDNEYGVMDVQRLLDFQGLEPDFDIVSAVSLRKDGNHYDWWATRTGPEYRQGASEVPRNFKQLDYGKFYSTSNGLCLYRAQPFKDGVRHGWINLETNKFDCEMVVLCQEFRKRGHNNIFVNYRSESRHY